MLFVETEHSFLSSQEPMYATRVLNFFVLYVLLNAKCFMSFIPIWTDRVDALL